VVEACHDDKGIIWPENIAPFKVHLISLKENEVADKVYNELKSKGIEVLYDDRDLSAGEKFADADLIGCPYRLLISKKTLALESLELKKRNEKDIQIVKIKDILSYV
jgi:prolyl-tRNA synthetase